MKGWSAGVAIALVTCASLVAPGVFAQSVLNDVEEYVVLVDAGAVLRPDPSSSKVVHRFEPKDFARGFRILERLRTVGESGSEHYRIEVTGASFGTRRGWIDGSTATVLTNINASGVANQRTISAERTEVSYRRGLNRRKTSMWRKVVVVSNPSSESGQEDRIGIFNNPRLEGTPRATVSIFELRYLFTSVAVAKQSRAILVGKRPDLSVSTAVQVLDGWIDSRHVVEWNTRQVFEFDKRNFAERKTRGGLGLLYRSENALRRAIDKGGRAGELISEDDSPEPMAHLFNRFPVIKKLGKKGKHGFYKVAHIGRGRLRGGGTAEAGDIAIQKDKITAIVSSREVKFAILIDATEGMDHVIEDVKTAVYQFFKKFANPNNPDQFLMAIGFYRDFPDRPAGPFWLATDFTNSHKKIADALDTIKAKSASGDVGGWAFPEALYYGIDQSIEQFSWGRTTLKYLFVVGDHGSHKNNADYLDAFLGRFRLAKDHLNGESLAKKLQDSDIRLNAIHVNTATKSRRGHDVSSFVSDFDAQMTALIGENQFHQRVVRAPRSTSDAYLESLHLAAKSSTELRRLLALTLCEMQNRADCGALIDPKVESPSDGDNPSLFSKVSAYNAEFREESLRIFDLNPALVGASQYSLVGYVSDHNPAGLRQLEFRVLVEKDTIENLKQSLKKLEQALRRDPAMMSRDELEDTLVRLLRAMTGDQPDKNENISIFLEKRMGLPIRTELLDLTVGQFVSQASNKNGEFRLKAIQNFAESGAILEAVLREREIDPKGWDPKTRRYRYGFVKDKSGREKVRRWFFNLETPLLKRIQDYTEGKEPGDVSDQTHAWLPLTFLP